MVSNGFTVVNKQVNINLIPSLSVLIVVGLIITLFVIGFFYLGYSITKDQLIVIVVTFLALRKMTGINDDNREESYHDNLLCLLLRTNKVISDCYYSFSHFRLI